MMRNWKTMTILGASLLMIVAATPVMAQPGGPGGGRGPFGDPEEFFRLLDEDGDGAVKLEEFTGFRERMRERFQNGNQGGPQGQQADRGDRGNRGRRGGMANLQELLGASDEEWAILEPMIEKVQTAQRSLQTRGRFGGESFPEAAALREVLDEEDASSDEVAAALKAYREARTKKEGELKEAQTELVSVVTITQEAHLVMANILQ